jgi:hypothetical protein
MSTRISSADRRPADFRHEGESLSTKAAVCWLFLAVIAEHFICWLLCWKFGQHLRRDFKRLGSSWLLSNNSQVTASYQPALLAVPGNNSQVTASYQPATLLVPGDDSRRRLPITILQR